MELIDLIFKWQTLVGGILGGLFAMGAALIVANSAKRHEEVISAYILIADLKAITVFHEVFEKEFIDQSIKDDKYHIILAGLLASHPLKLSGSFESSAFRLATINADLAVHLMAVTKFYKEIQPILHRLNKDSDYFEINNRCLRPTEKTNSDVHILIMQFKQIVNHANCALILIPKLILSYTPTFYRIIYRFHLNKNEKDCRAFLEGKADQNN